MRSITRLAAVLCALAASVALAACGSDDDGGSAAAQTTGTQAASSGFPVTIEHKFGTTEIAEPPERVVTAGYTELDTVLALGVTPVATREFFGGYDWRNRPWAPEGSTPPESVGAEELNVEAVAAQRPDLIVAINTGMTKADYERLSKIAPTIATSGDYVDFGMPWQEQTQVIGRALGREEQAEQVVSDLEASFEQAREEHPEFVGASAIMAYGGPDGYGAYATEDTRSRFLTDLGFEVPARIDELAGDRFYTEFSQEQFRLMDRDFVLMYGPQAEIEDDPVFSRLDAFEEGRVMYLDVTDQLAGALGYSTPLSLQYALDEHVDDVATAVDGDPATEVTQPE